MSGRRARRSALLLLSMCAVTVSSAEAQVATLIPGVRTRIRAPGSVSGRLTGTVVNRTADSLSIAMENGVPVRLPISALTSVEISRGKSRSKGAMKGAIWGGGFGVLSGLFSDSGQQNCSRNCASRGEIFAASVFGGALLGAGIGAAVQSERWDRLEVPARTALTYTRGGPTVVVSLRF